MEELHYFYGYTIFHCKHILHFLSLHLCSCSWSQRKSFQPFTFEYDVSCGLVIYGLYYVELCSFYIQFVEFLIMKGYWFFKKSMYSLYNVSIKYSHMVVLFYSINVVYHLLSYRCWTICGDTLIFHLIMVYDPFNVLLNLFC